MGSIDALARAIKEFSGGVVIVSHDFRLISQVAEQLWEVKDKKIVDLSKQGSLLPRLRATLPGSCTDHPLCFTDVDIVK